MASGRFTHVVVCGFSRSGTTLLYNMLRQSAVGVECPPHEASINVYKTPADRDRITKRPLDIFRLDDALPSLRDRELKVVIAVRDPRSLMSSFHRRVPEQEMQGYDYCCLVGPTFTSYSFPGILPTHEAITRFIAANPDLCEVVRFEDLVADPEAVRTRLQAFTGIEMVKPFSSFHDADIPQKLSVQLNGVRPVDRDRAESWKSQRARVRVARQFALEPALHDVLRHWGYEADDSWLEPPAKAPVGACVRFDPKAPAALYERRRDQRGLMLGVFAELVQKRDPWPYLAQYDGDLALFTSQLGEVSADVLWLSDTPGALCFLRLWRDGAQDVSTNPSALLSGLVAQLRSEGEIKIQQLPPTMVGAGEKQTRPSMQPFFDRA